MRTIGIGFLVLLTSGCSHYMKIDRTDDNINVLTRQTVDIMKRLDFPIRKNLAKDDSLRITVYKGTLMTCHYSQAIIKPYSKISGMDTNNRWYIKPEIVISSILDSIFSGKKDTSRFIYVKALGSVIHELTHYLQNEWVSDEDYNDGTKGSFRDYFFQPVEFQAEVVEAYYLLNFTDKKSLKNILNSNYSIGQKRTLLVDLYFKMEYPLIHDTLFKSQNIPGIKKATNPNRK